MTQIEHRASPSFYNLTSLYGPRNQRGPIPQRDAVIFQPSHRESKPSHTQSQPLTSCGFGCVGFCSSLLLLMGLCHPSWEAGRWGKGQHKEPRRRLCGDSSLQRPGRGHPQACGAARECHPSRASISPSEGDLMWSAWATSEGCPEGVKQNEGYEVALLEWKMDTAA